ncbi:amino acid permease [Seiridium cupressi]
MSAKEGLLVPRASDEGQLSEGSDVRVSHSTSQSARTLDVYWYILNISIGSGIYSLPSGIFMINGSVAIHLFLWVAGAIVAASGLCMFVEFGLAMPRSGGEKNYLERVYRKPRHMITCVIASLYTLFGGNPASSLAFGSYVFHAAGYADAKERWESRAIAVGCVTLVTIVHAFLPKWGLRAIRVLAYYKLILLSFIICAGFAALAGRRHVPDPRNFENAFAIGNGEEDGYGYGGLHGYGTALIRIGYAYGGVSSVTTILSEFRNPQKGLSVAAPLAMGTVAILYVLVNIAYFAAIPKAQFAKADVVIAATFFENVFGDSVTTQVLSALIAVSNLGNVLAASFDTSRMNQELAKEGILPFSHLLASDKPCGAPTAALLLCWASTIVLLLAPPPGPIYDFLVDAAVYPRIVIGTLTCFGLLYLRLNPKENWSSPFKAPLVLVIIWAAHHAFVTAMPLVPPPSNAMQKSMPYFIAPVIGIVILTIGVLYWVVWAKFLPKIRGYTIEATRAPGADGAENVEFKKVQRNPTPNGSIVGGA